MASAVLFLDLKGRLLLSRNYRGDIPLEAAADRFTMLLQELEDLGAAGTSGDSSNVGVAAPVVADRGIHYIHIRHNNLYLLALARRNPNVMALIMSLHRFVQVFKEYFCELEEESLRDNFVIVYELLDEMMDFGYAQTTETKILQQYITQQSFQLEAHPVKPPSAVTGAVSWRAEGIKYRKNEVFLDVIESVNLLANAAGNVLRSEVMGSVQMRCYLSGMPELKLGLNDRVLFDRATLVNGGVGSSTRSKTCIDLEDIKFHQCVRLPKFSHDRTISFIPADGVFELFSYRVSSADSARPLIWVECIIENASSSRIDYLLRAKSQFKRRSAASNVEIELPVPEDADTPRFKTAIGSAKFAPEKNAIIWSISYFPGGKEFTLRARIGLPSVRTDDPERRMPINVRFEIPYFTLSGIQVRYLKIMEKSGYQALPWVRYITQNGGTLVCNGTM